MWKPTPTPRDLKLFVNELGALHRIWQHEFPLTHLACHALMSRSNQNVQQTLVAGNTLDRVFSNQLGPDYRENVAAMEFGVKPELAVQMLLRPAIEEAIAGMDVAKLAAVHNRFPSGFLEVLPDILWPPTPGVSAVNAASCIVGAEVLGVIQEILHSIAPRLKSLAEAQNWTSIEGSRTHGLVSLARVLQAADNLPLLVDILHQVLRQNVNIWDSESAPGAAFGSLAAAMIDLSQFFRSTGNADAFETRVMPEVGALLQRPISQDPRAICTLLELISSLRAYSPAAKTIAADLAEMGAIDKYISLSIGRKDYETVSICLFTHLIAVDFETVTPHESVFCRWTRSVEEVMSDPVAQLAVPPNFVRVLLRTETLGRLPSLSGRGAAPRDFCLGCARVIIEDENLSKSVPTKLVVDSWDFFGQISTPPGLEKSVDKGPIEMRRDLPFDQFMTNLCARGLQEEIRGTTFDPDRFGLYYRAVGCGMTDAEEFRDWLVGGLQRLPAEKWRDEIVSEGKLLWVILKLASQEVPVDLPPLVYALAEYARELAAGAPIPLCDVMEAGEHRSLLFKSLGEAGGQGLRDSIYETAKAANGEIDGRFFRIFGEQFGSAPGRSRC